MAKTHVYDRDRRWHRPYTLGLVSLVLCPLMSLLGCDQKTSDVNDAIGSTIERVETNVLPPMLDESAAVLRNLVNLLALMPEICATPLSELGDFQSSMPELKRAQQQTGDVFTWDEEDVSWEAIWRHVVFGDADGGLTGDTATLSVDVKLTLRFRDQGFGTLEAVPFALAPASAVDTEGTLAPCEEREAEGFYLLQDVETGVWTLSWCAQGASKRFAGEVSAVAPVAVSRVLRRASDDAESVVSSLSVNSAATDIVFDEITAPGEDKGFRFYVRPGELVRFELNIGPEDGEPESLTREQIFLGDGDIILPPELNPGEFELVSSLPIMITTRPAFTTGEDDGTFIWQDTEKNQCPSGQEQWRIRLSTSDITTFSGDIRASNADNEAAISATAVGACPANSFEVDDDEFEYTCTVQGTTLSGYDLCTRAARRVLFAPGVFADPGNEDELLRTPSLVRIGATESQPQGSRPPSQDPFTIIFALELEERHSSRELKFEDATILLQGTTLEEGSVPLQPDQVSREPLCQPPVDPARLQILLTGDGEYATARFEGSQYELDDVRFIDAGGTFDVGASRLPDLGDVILQTRTEDDLQNTADITAPMTDISDVGTQVISLIDVELQFDTFELDFFGQPIFLTVE